MIDRHGADSASGEHRQLWESLTAQRECVLAIVEGLDEAALRKTVVPSDVTSAPSWANRIVTTTLGLLLGLPDRRDEHPGQTPGRWCVPSGMGHPFLPARTVPLFRHPATNWPLCLSLQP